MLISEEYKTKLQNLAGIIAEAKNHKNEYGALMLMVEYDGWDKILKSIDKEDLYDDETKSYGLEKETHTTVLFGFHKNADVDKMKELIKENTDGPIEIILTNITHFDNEEKGYDVLKFDVKSPILHKLNKLMTENFPYTNDHPIYHPHTTIGYLLPGKAKKYEKKGENIKIKCDKFCYSPPGENAKKIYFSI